MAQQLAIVGVHAGRISVNFNSMSHILECKLTSEGWIAGIMPKENVIWMKPIGPLFDRPSGYCAHKDIFVFFFLPLCEKCLEEWEDGTKIVFYTDPMTLRSRREDSYP